MFSIAALRALVFRVSVITESVFAKPGCNKRLSCFAGYRAFHAIGIDSGAHVLRITPVKTTLGFWVYLPLLLVALLWSVYGSEAQAQSVRPVLEQKVEYPRSNGYQLGDRFQHTLQISLRRPYALVTDSLPASGRVSEFIELHEVIVDRQRKLNSTQYRVTLRYQVINYDDALVGTSVPPAFITFATETDVYPVVLEAWGLTISPFLMKEPRNKGDLPALEKLGTAPLIPIVNRVGAVCLLLLTGLLLLFPALYKKLLVPLLHMRNRPFTTAFRQIKRRLNKEPACDLDGVLRDLHKAFNSTLGRTMLSDDVESFVSQHPEFSKCKKQIVRFFQLSDQCFYGASETPSQPGQQQGNLAFIKLLSASLRRREWSAARRSGSGDSSADIAQYNPSVERWQRNEGAPR